MCGHGNAARYDLPADFGVCWDPRDCATLNPPDCGAFGSLCGTCCVPACGAAGASDGCGGTCQACVSGADSDHDGLLDCSEQNDHDAWTDPLVFNGVIARRGNSCGTAPVCSQVDTLSEINACFAPIEDNRLHAGWDFNTSNTNICQSGFSFDLPWQGCGTNFGVHYEGSIRLEASGTHCFAVAGLATKQCGSLFFNGASAALISGSAAQCYSLSAGIYPIEWFYETAGATQSELHLRYCFGGASACTPTQALPGKMLRSSDDATARVCAADTPCTETCPCGVGGVATTDDQCAQGLVRRTDVADQFGQPAGTGVCWDPRCDDRSSPLYECGTPTALCGSVCPTCTPAPQCAGKSCGYDGCHGSCGVLCTLDQAGCTKQADCADGLVCAVSGTSANVCLPEICQHPGMNPCSNPANAGRTTQCGKCPACIQDCSGRVCGPAPNHCGTCDTTSLGAGQFCTNGGQIRTQKLSGTIAFPPLTPEGPTTPGTLPGQFSVSDFGQATYSIPIQVPPGRNGIEPQLALTYSSASGNGYLGMGWGLTGLSAINRCPKTIAQDPANGPDGISYTQDDRFCLDGNRLVLLSDSATYGGDGTEYRTEEETFSRIRSYSGPVPNEPGSFEVRTRDGRIMTYDFRIPGNTPLPGVRFGNFAERNPSELRTQTWLLTKVADRFGNAMRISYISPPSAVNGAALTLANGVLAIFGIHAIGGPVREYYPWRFEYTDHAGTDSDRSVELTYVPRKDLLAGYQYGVRFERTQRLEKITTFARGQAIFEYLLGYQEPQVSSSESFAYLHERTLLTSVTQCARSNLQGDAQTDRSCKPATVFNYDAVTPGFDPPAPVTEDTFRPPRVADTDADFVGRPLTLDLDGNGQDDVLYSECQSSTQGSTVHPCDQLTWGLLLNGKPAQSNQYLASDRMVSQGSDHVLTPGTTFVVDYDLDGRDDVLEIDVAHRQQASRIWSVKDGPAGPDGKPIGQLTMTPINFALGGPVDGGNVYMLDANGDGAADMLVCTPDHVVYDHRTGSANIRTYTWDIRLHNHAGGFNYPLTLPTHSPACRDGSVIDINGDGKEELLLNTTPLGHMKTGLHGPAYFIANDASAVFWPLTGAVTDTVLPATRKNAVRLTFDANGDGLVDVIEISDDFHAIIWLNTGTGFVSRESVIDLSQIPGHYNGSDFLRQVARFAIPFDENSDGRTDLIVRADDVKAWTVLRSNGESFSVVSLTASGPQVGGPLLGDRYFVYDENHDGLSDLLDQTYGSVIHRSGAPVQRLLGITNGLGARTEIEYGLLNDDAVYSHSTDGCVYPIYCPRPTGAVVRRELVWDDKPKSVNPNPTRAFRYGYSAAASDLQGRGSLGFGTRTIVDEAADARAELSGGHQQLTLEYSNKRREGTAYPYVGRIKKSTETTVTLNGRIRESAVDRVLITQNPSRHSFFASVFSETQSVTENTSTLKNVVFSWRYDNYGNVTHWDAKWDDIWDGKIFDQASIDTTFLGDSDHLDRWLINLPNTRTINAVGDSAAHRTQSFFYAEQSTDDIPAQYTGVPEWVYLDGDTSQTLGIHLHYDDFGLIDSASANAPLGGGGSQTRTTLIAYDDAHMFPMTITDANGHTIDETYDQGLGVQWGRSEDGRPGIPVIRQAIPDGFGRIRQVIGADGSTVDVDYLVNSDGGLAIQTAPAGAPSQLVTYDVLGREVQRRVDGFDSPSAPLFVETKYNDRGLIEDVSRAHKSGAPVDFTHVDYDPLGRPVLTTLPGLPDVHSCYLDNVACTQNSRGHTSCQVFNEHGELKHSIDPQLGDDRDCDAIATDVAAHFPAESIGALSPMLYSASHYRYDPFSAVISIHDAADNETTFDRDGYSRVLKQSDPDSGAWLFTYNGFGDLQTRTDPKNTVSSFAYDVLGRLIVRRDVPAGNVQPAKEARWVWDALFDAGFYGQLLTTNTSDGVGSLFSYDNFGRFESMQRTIPGDGGPQTLTMRVPQDGGYDDLGRLHSIAYDSVVNPAAPLTVSFHYNSQGYLDQLLRPDGTPYWSMLDTDANGLLAHELFGSTSTGLLTSRTYHPQTGTLASLQRAGVGGFLQTSQYAYENGFLKTITRTGAPTTTYDYDDRDRLKSAVRTDATGAVLHSEGYQYDDAGNIQLKTVADSATGASRSWSYAYNDGTGHPRAVKFITEGSLTQQYHYDDMGNLQSRSGDLQEAVAIQYNLINMPSAIGSAHGAPDEVFIDYDADGERVHKVGAASETFYLDDFYKRTRVPGGAFTEHLVVGTGGRTVAEVVRASDGTDSTYYLHEDHVGSIEAVTQQLSDHVSFVDGPVFEAYGQRLDSAASSGATSRGYAGHETAGEFGLINMKARMYDPQIGRFMAPDPIVAEPWHSEGINPYSYVLNSPTRFVDPFGLQQCPAENPLCRTGGAGGISGAVSASGGGSASGSLSIGGAGSDRASPSPATSQSEAPATLTGQPGPINQIVEQPPQKPPTQTPAQQFAACQARGFSGCNPGSMPATATAATKPKSNKPTDVHSGRAGASSLNAREPSTSVAQNLGGGQPQGGQPGFDPGVTCFQQGCVFNGTSAGDQGLHESLGPRFIVLDTRRSLFLSSGLNILFGVVGAGFEEALLLSTAARAVAAPLAEDVAITFAGGKYAARVLQQDVVALRYSGGLSPASGRFLTTQQTVRQIGSAGEARLALNLPPGATAEQLNAFVIPKGTTIYYGRVAGGGATATQIFIQDSSVLRAVP